MRELMDVGKNGQRQRLCDVCMKLDIDAIASGHSHAEHTDIGILKDTIERTDCPFCRLVSNALLHFPHWLLPKGVQSQLYLSPCANGRICIYSCDAKICAGQLEILTHAGKSNTVSKGSRTKFEGSIDFSHFQNAIDNCKKKHWDFCNNFRPEYQTHENIRLRFVDIDHDRLVKSWANQTYATLSYVWGAVSTLKTTKYNLSNLEKSGALLKLQREIPQVIQDAMKVTRALGVQYLWVDTLCIVQDDPVDKQKNIKQMNVIYTHAHVNLVAMSGKDANAGLRGISVLPSNSIEIINGKPMVATPPVLSPLLKSSYYHSRAWTFQEQLLPPRNLFFTDQQIYYQCSSNICCEDGVSRDGLSARGDIGNINPLIETRILARLESSRSSPNFHVYRTIIEQYTTKSLAYAEDVLNAFSGIIAAHESVYGKYVQGIPESVFDLAILWIPVAAMDRIPIRGGTFKPSWSWVSYDGPIYHPLHPGEPVCAVRSLLSVIYSGGQLKYKIRRHEALNSPYWMAAQKKTELEALPGLTNLSLAFCASTIPLALPPTSRPGTEVVVDLESHQFRITRLIINGNCCGILFGWRLDILRAGSLDNLKLVAISENERLRFREPSVSFWQDFNIDAGMFPDEPYCTLNVLLVKTKDDVAEKITWGIVHLKAWKDCGPEYEVIKLE